MMDNSTVERRVAARDQARVVAGLIVEDVGRIQPDAQGAFWDELRRLLPLPMAAPTPAKQPEPFADRQAKAFGRGKISFGKYAGETVDSVPLDYLRHLCDPQPFILSLKRYLASQRIAAETEAE